MSNTVRSVRPMRCAWCGHPTLPKRHKRRGEEIWCSVSCGWRQGAKGRSTLYGKSVEAGRPRVRLEKSTRRKPRPAAKRKAVGR